MCHSLHCIAPTVSCSTSAAVGEKLGTRQTWGKLCVMQGGGCSWKQPTRGMPLFEVLTMVSMRQVMKRRGKQHSTVESTAVHNWSDTCSKHCVVHRSWPRWVLKQSLGAQCWLWQREGREAECFHSWQGRPERVLVMNEYCWGVFL